MSKDINTLVSDIYEKISVLSEGKAIEVSEKELDKFATAMRQGLKHWLTPRARDRGTLRMSNIGKPDRQLWYEINATKESEAVVPSTQIKFLYGHLLEELLLFFCNLAGHDVSDEQKEVDLSGVKGHMDCKINGEVVDIKTSSNYAFKKFKLGTLPGDDPFGYLAQLSGYEQAENTNKGGFLVMNKETGELTFFCPDELDKINAMERIKHLRKVVKKNNPPSRCYDPVKEGLSGNYKLPTPCKYCVHKFECHADANEGKGLRLFRYSNGLTYLTQVEKEPKVEEVIA
jgi:hypothetical protein